MSGMVGDKTFEILVGMDADDLKSQLNQLKEQKATFSILGVYAQGTNHCALISIVEEIFRKPVIKKKKTKNRSK
jgi:hypothetical protein